MTEALRPRITEIEGPDGIPGDLTDGSPPMRPRVMEDDGVGQMEIGEQPQADSAPEIAIGPKPQAPRHGAIALGCVAVLILGLTSLNTADFLIEKFQRHPALGFSYTAVICIGLAGGLYWLAMEWRALRSLRAIEQMQQELGAHQIDRATANRAIMRSLSLLQRDARLKPACTAYLRALSSDHQGEDAIDLFAKIVLRPADELAKAAVRRAALQAFGIVAVSPSATTDTILFLARGMGMVRAVASIYGQRPTSLGTLYLVKRLVGEASLIGATDLAGSAVLEQMGGDLVGKLSATTAESVLAAQRMARLGFVAMQMCRPVKFREGEAPRLSDLIPGARPA